MINVWHEIRVEAEAILERHYERCIDFVPSINFSAEKPQHIIALCLYCSIVELCPSLMLLVGGGQFVGVPQLLRSMYEADIDLINALNDEHYHKYLSADYLVKMINVIQEAHNTEASGFMAAAGGIGEMRKLLKKRRQELGRLKADGYGPLQITDRFKRAHRSGEYISAYAYLCGYAHNDVGALEVRHLRENNDGDVSLLIFEEIDAENKVHLLDLANTVLLGASGRTHSFFESGKFDDIEDMFKELNGLRGQWPKEVVTTSGKK